MKIRNLLLFLFLTLSPLGLQADTIPNDQEIAALLTDVQKLIAQGQYHTAADLLERVLMLAPETETAADTYRQLLHRLAQQRQSPPSIPDPPPVWQPMALVGVKLGGGNNLNRGPKYATITQNVNNPEELLELADEQRAQAGYGIETYGSLQGNLSWQQRTRLNLQLQFQHRSTNRYNFTDYIDVNGGASLQHRLGNHDEIGLALYGDFIRYDNHSRFYALDLQSRYRWRQASTCQPQIGIDLQWQHQVDNGLFDQLYTGLHSSLQCQFNGSFYSLDLNSGNGWALRARPGGNQAWLHTQFNHYLPINWPIARANLNAYFRYDYQQDQKGYSPLFDNAKRSLQRISLGAQYRWPIAEQYGHWFGVFNIGWQRQYSNIQLFEFNALESWLGVEVIW